MASRLEPHYELRNFLRNNLTDLNSANRDGAYWIYADWPTATVKEKNKFPRIIITKIVESGEIIGLGEIDTYDNLVFQIDVFCNKSPTILTKTNTDESIGTISNSPRINFDDVPNTVTNIKHNTTSFGIVTAVNDDASFTAPGSLATGTVQWSRSTGNMNFSSADLTSYSGQTITSTNVLSMDSEMTVKWIAREIVRKIRANWKTDTTIGSLLHPKKISGPTLVPYDRDPGLSHVIIEYQFNRFNTGE